jgi:Rps23 Pro-64 3,4-dihydroxylase Tpa1-like proline 4-hydroxylase
MKNQLQNSKEEYFIKCLLSKLEEEKENIIKQWNNPEGTTTRYFSIDNLLPKKDVESIYNAFPRTGEGFFDRDTFREKKRTSANLREYDQVLSDITYAFQSKVVVKYIEDILSYEVLEPDPKLYAGGLSMMFPNDYLNPHIDNSHDGNRERYRRMNLLFYVSPDWRLENGGNFELWNEDRTIPRTFVAHQNRLVVMETSKTSWHSVSKVTTDRPRCCVSNYYFSTISPDGSDYFHVTSFDGRPGQSLRKFIVTIDNALRNTVSKVFKIGRGKNQINKDS